MDQKIVAYVFSITGKVQRVFFRASTAREATRLGVSGYAMNLPDGAVEVLAVGPEPAVTALRRWLAQGPPSARVDVVRAAERPELVAGVTGGFRTR